MVEEVGWEGLVAGTLWAQCSITNGHGDGGSGGGGRGSVEKEGEGSYQCQCNIYQLTISGAAHLAVVVPRVANLVATVLEAVDLTSMVPLDQQGSGGG